MVRDRHPGADRREAVGGAEPEVAEPREALQVRVHDEHRDRDRPQVVRLRRELEDGDEEERERGRAEEDDLGDGQLPARELAAGGARVARVDTGIDEPVERHRERAGPDHRERDPDEIVRGRRLADGEERADVRERQREDGVLDLDEPRVARRQRGDGAHVCSCTVASSASRRSACSSAGRSTAYPSRQPPVEPGRLTTSAEPATPAVPRESKPCGVFAIESARSACAIPGASRSSTSRVASGVTSRGARPVPPVVRTRRDEAASALIAAAISSRSSGTTRRSTSYPSPRSSSSSASPLRSSRVPATTPSDTVSTAAFRRLAP